MTRLIDALHELQDTVSCPHATDLATLAEIFLLSQSEVHSVASFFHHFDIMKPGEPEPPSLLSS